MLEMDGFGVEKVVSGFVMVVDFASVDFVQLG